MYFLYIAPVALRRNLLANVYIRQFIARLLLGLLVLMQINSAVFRHAHRLSNGKIISHAHPYNIFGKSCPLSANPHTTHELLLLDALSNPTFVPTFALLVAFLLLGCFTAQPVITALIPGVITVFLARPTLRGPPTQSFLLD